MSQEQWDEILIAERIDSREIIKVALKIFLLYIPAIILITISVFILDPYSYWLYLVVSYLSVTFVAWASFLFWRKRRERKRDLGIDARYKNAETEFYRRTLTKLQFQDYLARVEQSKVTAPKNKRSAIKVTLICLGVLFVGFLLWALISSLVEVFADDPYDDSDDYDWIWALLVPFGIWLIWSFISDASGAASYETDVIMRADAANKLYLKNNAVGNHETTKDKKSKLSELQDMFEEGLISKSEYEKARAKILGD